MRHNLVDKFKKVMGFSPNMDNPESFNEKILYRKLFDRRPILTLLQDKLRCKEFVLEADTHIRPIPTIDHGAPPTFKTQEYPSIARVSNSTGRTYYMESAQDWRKARLRFMREKNAIWGWDQGEWAYSEIPFNIIIEPYLGQVEDIQFYVFNGVPEFIKVFGTRENIQKRVRKPGAFGVSHFKKDGTHIPVQMGDKLMGPTKVRPEALEILDDVGEISQDIDFVRVDLLYSPSESKWYLGEFTVYPGTPLGSGHIKWSNMSFDKILGSKWEINKEVLSA